MLRRWFGLGLVVFVCGCQTTMMSKPQMIQAEQKRDAVECRALAQQAVPPRAFLRSVLVDEQYRQCLEGRGYVAEQP